MQQLATIWSTLDLRRRVIVILASAGMFAAVLGLARIASTPTMSLLYSGLEPNAAGDVIAALEQQGAAFDVRGSSIYVDAARRDALRMTLAGDGLPANAAKGYELLDSLTGFGTTSQMFDAAYWRAKEGELARTIVSGSLVQSARVHISNQTTKPFSRGSQPTASVTVTTTSGAVSDRHAKALRYLVASAVAGLGPENVSIIDGRSGVVVGGDAQEGASAASGSDRAQRLKQNVERLLEARVGAGNAVVEVSIDTVTEREQIVERRFDPEGRVAISTDTEERTTSANDARGGNSVTVASNLAEGDAGGAGQNSSSQNSETRERVNFEVSETQRELLRVPGSIRRLSVAVLVDGVRTVDAAGTETWAPRSDDELGALRELIASAVGYDEGRGDTVTIKSMEFQPVPSEGSVVQASIASQLFANSMALLQLGVLALVALVLGLFVVRPVLSGRGAAGPPAAGLPPPAQALAELPSAAAFQSEPMPLTGEIDEREFPPGALPIVSGSAIGGGAPGGEQNTSSITQEPVHRLRQLIEDREEETVDILRSWIEDREERV